MPRRDRRRPQSAELHGRRGARHADPAAARKAAPTPPSPACGRGRRREQMSVDLAIIGAGPAGMAAAVLAAELGLDTMLVDEADTPGGQIYRGIEKAAEISRLDADIIAGRALVAALRGSTARYRPATTVWHRSEERRVGKECRSRWSPYH